MPFPGLVSTQPAPAVLGDFASVNPRFTVMAGPGGLVSGPNGLYVGRFAWLTSPLDVANAPIIANNFGTGVVGGFMAREQQASITQFLAEASLLVPQGYPVTLYSGGDFWVLNSGSTQALVGQKCYALYASGNSSFAATGSPTTASATASTIAAGTSSVTGSITGNILTVTFVGSGTLYAGTTLSGPNVATGTLLQSQISGTTGGIGTYYVSIGEQAAASTTISGTYGLFTAGTTTGTFQVGSVLSGTNVTSGTYITAFLSGTGGAGTYIVSPSGTTSSTTITGTTNIETKWYAMSSGNPGELVKISDHALG